MAAQRHLLLEGRVAVRLVDKAGRTLHRLQCNNAIVDGGRALVGQLLIGEATAAPISHLAVGADPTAPTPGDSALAAEIGTIDRAPISATPLTDSIGLRITAQVSSPGDAAISEAALFNAADHGAGVMYNRVVFPTPLPISASLDLVFEWDVTF